MHTSSQRRDESAKFNNKKYNRKKNNEIKLYFLFILKEMFNG